MNIKKIVCCCTIMLLGISACNDAAKRQQEDGIIYTVNGKIDIDELEFALTHEHLMSNFGMDIDSAFQYDEVALLNQVVPYVKEVKSSGVHSIFDCTTAYFGRRVDILKKISDATGVQIITNTGFYGAANDRYVPDFAFEASAEEISKVWIKEFEEGIEGSGIKPGFIKLAFDGGDPSTIDKKLFLAGILTHKKTGLTIGVHTGNNPVAAAFQMDLLEQNNLSTCAWIWFHANWLEDTPILLEAASRGAWISLDGVKTTNIKEHIDRLKLFKSRDLLHRVLLSHDGDGYPMGGEIREFEALQAALIPAMLEDGFNQKDINQLTIENPKEAFMIRVRQSNY